MGTLPAIEHVQRFSANVPKFYADGKPALFNRRQLACNVEDEARRTANIAPEFSWGFLSSICRDHMNPGVPKPKGAAFQQCPEMTLFHLDDCEIVMIGSIRVST